MITTLIRLWRRPPRALAVMALCLLVPAEAHAQSERLEAPFGDTVSERVPFITAPLRRLPLPDL